MRIYRQVMTNSEMNLSYTVVGGEKMTKYEKMLKLVAQEHNTTPDEVESEIKEAIKAAGLDVSPEVFIALCVAKVRAEMLNNE